MTAHERSLQTLEEYLTPLQRRSLRERKCFEVRGGETGTVYTIMAAQRYYQPMLARRRHRPRGTAQFLGAQRGLCYRVESIFGPTWPMGDKMLALYCQVRFNEKHIRKNAGHASIPYEFAYVTPLSEPLTGWRAVLRCWFTTRDPIPAPQIVYDWKTLRYLPGELS